MFRGGLIARGFRPTVGALTTLWCTPVERPFHSTIRVPGSKSIANRAHLRCTSEGRSTLKNLPDGDDTRAMLSGLQALGIEVTRSGSTARCSRCSVAIWRDSRRTRRHDLSFFDSTRSDSWKQHLYRRTRALEAASNGPLLNALRSLGAQIADHDGGLPVSIRAHFVGER